MQQPDYNFVKEAHLSLKLALFTHGEQAGNLINFPEVSSKRFLPHMAPLTIQFQTVYLIPLTLQWSPGTHWFLGQSEKSSAWGFGIDPSYQNWCPVVFRFQSPVQHHASLCFFPV